MDIVAAYEQVGTYRGAAALCGTTHKTVRRVIEANRLGEAPERPRHASPSNTDVVRDLIAEKVRATDGRISAKRLLLSARAAGYVGSARNFRRAVATAKKRWQRQRRMFRPWVPVAGEHRSSTGAARVAGRSSAPCWPGVGGGSCAWPATRRRPPPWGCWTSASSC